MTLKINNLNYSVQNKRLLNNVNVTINQPKLIGIIGANGAGKSTLLNCISGLNPSQNSISINGNLIEEYTNLKLSKIRASLPQQSTLSFPFSAKEIVAMSFALTNISIEKQNKIIYQCLDYMSANHLANRNFLNLSGGEKQRIQIARVLAQLLQEKTNSMRYFLLDEPTAPLDLKYQYQLFDYLKLLTQKNIAVLVVIHDINIASSYCDEIWVMHEGSLIEKGYPIDVISKKMLQQVFDIDIDVKINHQIPQIQKNTQL